jgi:hypothetical protein
MISKELGSNKHPPPTQNDLERLFGPTWRNLDSFCAWEAGKYWPEKDVIDEMRAKANAEAAA